MKIAHWMVLAIAAAGAAMAQTAAPALSLSGNDAQTFDLPRGWPLIVKLTVLHSQHLQTDPPPADLVVSPSTGGWYGGVTFNVSSAGGAGAPWPLALAQEPDSSNLVLPANSLYQAVWQMNGDATAALPLGTYRVKAHLAVKDGGGWTGAVDSPPMVVNVIDTTDPLSDDDQAAQTLLQARYAINQGDFNGAGAIADGLLASQPSNWHALEMRALLYEQAGDLQNAAGTAAAAVAAASNAPFDTGVFTGDRVIQEPPEFLLRLKSRLRAAYRASPGN